MLILYLCLIITIFYLIAFSRNLTLCVCTHTFRLRFGIEKKKKRKILLKENSFISKSILGEIVKNVFARPVRR